MYLVPILDTILFAVLMGIQDSSARKELYAAIKNGDERAFKTFFDEYYDSLFVFLRSRNINREIAEDLIQKAFIYIWENRQKIKPDLSLKAYLFRIVYTRMINHTEQERHFLELEKHVNGTDKTPLDMTEYNDLVNAFQQAIEDMPEKRRLVFESCFLQELTYKETAENLSISVKTVENHMALAFRDLRETLKIFKEN